MGFTSKKTKRLIAATLLTGSMILVPEVCEFPFSSVAFTEVKMYMGTAEDYASPIESQDVAKLRAREKAIQSAKEQAGVVLKNYSRSINAELTDDEISVITANTYKLIGEPVYEQTVAKVSEASTVIVWKANVSVNIDDDEVKKWVQRDNNDKIVMISQNQKTNALMALNNQQTEALRKRAENATSTEERNRLKAEFDKVDKDFLYNQKIQEAERLYYNFQFNKAANECSVAISIDPNRVEAYKMRGDVYAARGNAYDSEREREKALNDYNQAIKIDPGYTAAYVNRSKIYAKFGDYDKAIADCNRVIDMDPSVGYVARSLVYSNFNERAKAIADCDKAIELDPKNADAYIRRGINWMISNNFKRSLADMERAIELNPSSLEARCMYVGVIMLDILSNKKTDELKMALREKLLPELNQLIEIYSENQKLYELRASVYRTIEENERAEQDSKTIRDLFEKNSPAEYDELAAKEKVQYGDTLCRQKLFKNAIAVYSEAIRIDPTYGGAYFKRGNAYSKMYTYDKAIQDYDEAIKLEPSNIDAYKNRGDAYNAKGRSDLSAKDYRMAIQVCTKKIEGATKKDDLSTLYLSRAMTHISLQEFEEAIRDLTSVIQNKSLDIKAVDSLVYMQRCRCYIQIGDKENAMSDYRKVVEDSGSNDWLNDEQKAFWGVK